MFDKIGRYAETVAVSTGQSRRGFLELLGRGASSLAAAAGAFLLFQGEIGATVVSGACYYQCPDGSFRATNCGSASNPCGLTIQHAGMTCKIYRSTCGYR
jgi:hypothetical protein